MSMRRITGRLVRAEGGPVQATGAAAVTFFGGSHGMLPPASRRATWTTLLTSLGAPTGRGRVASCRATRKLGPATSGADSITGMNAAAASACAAGNV